MVYPSERPSVYIYIDIYILTQRVGALGLKTYRRENKQTKTTVDNCYCLPTTVTATAAPTATSAASLPAAITPAAAPVAVRRTRSVAGLAAPVTRVSTQKYSVVGLQNRTEGIAKIMIHTLRDNNHRTDELNLI